MDDMPQMTAYKELNAMLTFPLASGCSTAEYDMAEIEQMIGYASQLNIRAEAAEAECERLREQVRVLRIAVQEAYNYLDEQVGDDVESELYITFAVVREAWYAVRDTPA